MSGTWSVNTATNNQLRATSTGATSTPSATAGQLVFGNVQNPTTTNQTFFAWVTLFSDAAWATPVDTGVVAASTATQINFTASVDETLVFCAGTSGITTSSCSGATGSTVAFGALNSASASTGTSQLGVGTNGASGFAITVNGATLTCAACSGTPTISAIGASQAASAPGTEQFGFNLRDNATPNVGTEPDGAGNSTPAAAYIDVDDFTFATGNTIVSDSGSEAFRRFHAAYIANIGTDTEAGAYTATFTYIATATF